MIALLLSLLVAATGIPRTVDPDLTALAEKRAVEITTVYSHRYLQELNNGKWLLWAEVIGYNGGFDDPVAAIVDGWMASPEHAAILTDRRFSHIGCGATQAATRWYFACILADSAGTAVVPPEPPVPAPTPPDVRPSVPPAVTTLPDTAVAQ